MKIYEPTGMFRIVPVSRPFLGWGSKVWFTQTLQGVYQLHVGTFHPEAKELRVWKSRVIHPKSKMVYTHTVRHPRNPVLDQDKYKNVVRLPFLVPA